MIRIAAVGDVHYDRSCQGRLSAHLQDLKNNADLFLLAGDLTQSGQVDEARALAEDLRASPVPVVAALGNHDYHHDEELPISQVLREAGVSVLEGEAKLFTVSGARVLVAGLKGFGGGFVGACGTDFGEPEMKAFIRHTRDGAEQLKAMLLATEADYKIALLHYSPIPETLLGEKKEIYPFLGSYLLAEALDEGGADICFHGHAHKGTEKGATLGGVPVRNVALPVIRHAYNIYTLDKEGLVLHKAGAESSLQAHT